MVYLGEETNTARKVAIKVLYKEVSSNPVNIERGLKESNINFDHKNIIKMIEFVEKDNIYHIVSEYLEGESLDKYIERDQLVPREKAIQIACEVLRGLGALHAAKPSIIHRDIKPSNIFLCANGDIKIMDFGVARSLENGNKRLTKTGSVVGTPYYAAPEQIRSQTELINATTDIYSVGVTLYELLTGKVPFEGKSEYDTLKMQVEAPLPPHSKIPPALFKVIAKATAKNQTERYRSGQEFLRALQPFSASGQRANPSPKKKTPKRSVSGASVLNWILIPLLLGLGTAYFSTLGKLDAERYDAQYHRNKWVLDNVGLSEKNTDLKDSLSLVTDHYPIIIDKVPVRFLDREGKNILSDFKDKLIGEGVIKTIQPMVVYRSFVTETKDLQFYYRLYTPEGKLLHSPQVDKNLISPPDLFTNHAVVPIAQKQDGQFLLGGFWTKYNAGNYRLEVWHRDKCLFYRYFRIY